ncbi:uncharacterized protein G2W53_039429 [Senna tora]|uniref:Uncharacterized protein n=1 Tax=Senna tora TaxID=362788 RepID=A0A834SQM1_9FABA|nr:uncharacterized protein G2W53_039429 [Senna tora]
MPTIASIPDLRVIRISVVLTLVLLKTQGTKSKESGNTYDICDPSTMSPSDAYTSSHYQRTSRKLKRESVDAPIFEFLPTSNDLDAEPFPMVITANINGRPTLTKLRVVISIAQLRMKFVTPKGTDEIFVDLEEAKSCYTVNMNNAPGRHNESVRDKSLVDSDIIDLRDEILGTCLESSEELIPIRI